jgi:hypothetical protein
LALVADLAVVFEDDLLSDLGADLAADLGDDLAAGFADALPIDFDTAFTPALTGAFRVGFKASEPIGPTGTESRRVGVRPALTLAFFLATGLRTGSAGLGAPNFNRTGLSPQISSRL